jgi:hypothetical protein
MSAMLASFSNDKELLRAEIAATAARLIAEDGADYGTAKRKAARQILGDAKARGDILPDNAQIEDAVRAYNELFFSETQPVRLLHLRKLALSIMTELQQFAPYLTGAVLNGTAGEHSDIYLQLFVESFKEVEMYLLGKNIQFEVSETPRPKKHGQPVETLSFMWKNEGIHLTLHETSDLRNAGRAYSSGRRDRADLDAVRTLIMENDIK